MSYLDIVDAQLVIDEGDRNFPYDDATGRTLIRGDTLKGNITVGIGRNISGIGISADEKALMYSHDRGRADALARATFSTYDTLTDNRKAALLMMCFNLGNKITQFHATIAAVTAGDYDGAANDMLASSWHNEVGARAQRLADLMRNG